MEHVEDIDRGWKRIKRDMQENARRPPVVDVGILGTEAEREYEELVGEFTTNAAIGMFHEYGTGGMSLGRSGASHGGIPERSFIRAIIDTKHLDIVRLFERVVRGVLAGKPTLKKGLGLIGERVTAWIKGRIRKGIPPPLMPSTVDRKGSSKPLIDTGQLIGSITHAVRGAGEGDK